jgi:hypothetical protein
VGRILQARDAPLMATFHLLFEQFIQEFFHRPVFVRGASQEFFDHLPGGGHM